MKRLLFPMEYVSISQGSYGAFSHANKKALDIAGKDTSASKVYTSDHATVYDVRTDNVKLLYTGTYELTDGKTIKDPIVMYFHNTNKDLKKGQELSEWQNFMTEGKLGYATGNHVHIAIWPKASKRTSATEVMPETVFFCDKDIHTFSYYGNKVTRYLYWSAGDKNKNNDQLQVLKTNLHIRKTPSTKGAIIGYSTIGFWDFSETKTSGGYTWYKIGDNMWIAAVKDCSVLVKKEVEEVIISEVNEPEEIVNETVIETPKYIDFYTSEKDEKIKLILREGQTLAYKIK